MINLISVQIFVSLATGLYDTVLRLFLFDMLLQVSIDLNRYLEFCYHLIKTSVFAFYERMRIKVLGMSFYANSAQYIGYCMSKKIFYCILIVIHELSKDFQVFKVLFTVKSWFNKRGQK